MHILKYSLFLVLLLLGGIWSCTSPSEFSEIPEIEFRSFNKGTLIQGSQNQDTILLSIDFKDGDGDLGQQGGSDIEVKDTRLETAVPFTFSIPELPEQGAENGVTGTMRIKIFSVCCFQGSVSCEAFPDMPEDELIFSVQISDVAGNKSNVVMTDPIRLLCQ